MESTARRAVMGAYHQMGHHSDNLLWDQHIFPLFEGAILSPVNYGMEAVLGQISDARERGGLDMIFDPQLYYPASERLHLAEWPYLPGDFDTADLGSISWWGMLNNRLMETCRILSPAAVCSPIRVPGAFTNDYFNMAVRVANDLDDKARESGTRTLLTAVVRIEDLAVPSRPIEIASILSRAQSSGIYLVVYSDVEPRRELTDTEQLKGVMRLISALERSGMPVLVAFSSTEMVLWKAAGATSCATGKFFNLRRFTKSRWEEPTGGGGQLPYWFEESLVAFLRGTDVIRVVPTGLLNETLRRNPFSTEILNQIKNGQGNPWLALCWRQYMFGFADLERRIRRQDVDINGLLKGATESWLALEDASILMEEPRNNGAWAHLWRRALLEFRKESVLDEEDLPY
jgi:hypothetical protein